MSNQISNRPPNPKLPFFYRHLPIILGVIIAILIAGGIFAWQYLLEKPKEEARVSEEEIVPAEEERAVLKAIPFNILDSDKKLSEYLIENTDLIEGTEFTFIRTEKFVAFFTSHPYRRMVERGIIQKKEPGGFLALLEDDPCYCLGINVYAKRLVNNQPEFVISEFMPVTGTCVGYNYLRISKISENKFKDIWTETTFACYGAVPDELTSDIATIELKDLDNDNNFEIIRTGYT